MARYPHHGPMTLQDLIDIADRQGVKPVNLKIMIPSHNDPEKYPMYDYPAGAHTFSVDETVHDLLYITYEE